MGSHNQEQQALRIFNLYVLAVVLAYWNAWVDNVRDNEHSLTDLALKLLFLFSHSVKFSTDSGNLSLYLLSFVLLTLSHKTAYLLAHYLSFISQLVSLCFGCSVFLVKLSHLVNKNELFVLKLLLMFSFTVSGFSRTNFISSIVVSPFT